MGNPIQHLLKLTIAIFLAVPASATIVIIEFTESHIIVVADSRVSGGGQIPHDDGCKITQLDEHTFFFATGEVIGEHSQTGRNIWSVDQFSRAAFDRSKLPYDSHTLARIAVDWAESLRDVYEAGFRRYTERFTGTILMAQGVFGRDDPAGLRAYHAALWYSPNYGVLNKLGIAVDIEKLHAREIPIDKYGDNGAGILVEEFLNATTPRARTANVQFRTAFPDPMEKDYEVHRLSSAIGAATEWMTDKSIIGGPIDALVLTKDGVIRWVSRKPVCAK